MARRTTVVDDLDGTPGAEPVRFALDGVSYEVDLTAENADTLRDALSAYVSVARRLSGRAAPRGKVRAVAARTAPATGSSTAARIPGTGSRVTGRKSAARKPATVPPPLPSGPVTHIAKPSAIRAWCAENGIPINVRGRVPYSIAVRYQQAHA